MADPAHTQPRGRQFTALLRHLPGLPPPLRALGILLVGVGLYVSTITGLTFVETHPPGNSDPRWVTRAIVIALAVLLAVVAYVGFSWLVLAFGRPAITAEGGSGHDALAADSGATPAASNTDTTARPGPAAPAAQASAPPAWEVARGPGPQPARFTRHDERVVFVAALIVLASAWAVHRGADDFLARLHRPGDGAYGVGVTRLAVDPSPPQQICIAAAAWSRSARQTGQDAQLTGCARIAPPGPQAIDRIPLPFPDRPRAPIAVLALATWVDSLALAPAYGVVLVLLIIWAKRALSTESGSATTFGRSRGAGLSMAIIVAVIVLVDWLENGVTLALVVRAWSIVGVTGSSPGEPGCAGAFQAACAPFMPLFLGSPAFAAWALAIATLLKFLGLALVVLYLLALTIIHMQQPAEGQRKRLHGALRTLAALRVPLVAVVAYAVLISTFQIPEILWSWPDHALVFIFGVVLTALFALGVRWLGDRLVSHADEISDRIQGLLNSNGEFPRQDTWIAAIAAAPLLTAALLALIMWEFNWSIWKAGIPLITVVVVLVLTRGAGSPPHTAVGRPGIGRSWLPAALGATVLALLALALLSAATPVLLYTSLRGSVELRYLWLVAAAITLLVGAGRMAVTLTKEPGVGGRALLRTTILHGDRPVGQSARFWAVLLGAALGAWLLATLILTPDWGLRYAAPFIGTVGVVTLALLLMTAIGSSLVALITLLAPPASPFRVLRIAQTPVLLVVGLWWILAAVAPPADQLHDVRRVELRADMVPTVLRTADPQSGRVGESLAAAFAQWRWQNCLVAPSADAVPPSAADRPVAPLVLVATDGGGTFAASWTAYVVDRVLGYGHLPDTPCAGSNPGELDANRSPRSVRVFAVSGISGGSVGLATYAARSLDPNARQDSETCTDGPERCPDNEGRETRPRCGPRPGPGVSRHDGWVRTRIGRCEGLSPTLAWALYVEAPWSFIRTGVRRDRAIVLEDVWEQVWNVPGGLPHFFALRQDERLWEAEWQQRVDRARANGRGLSAADVANLYQTQAAADRVRIPILMLNGTSVESGCRFNGSVLESDARPKDEPSGRCLSPSGLVASAEAVLPATVDLADMLCSTEDIRLATVAMLSARFPYISPSGHLKDRCRPSRLNAPETWVVDGGYLDNTGTSTVLGLWAGLAPLIEQHNRDPLSRAFVVPFVIQIVSGYQEPAGPGAAPEVPQLIAPLRTIAATYSANQAVSTQGLQLLFSRPYVAYDGTPLPGSSGGGNSVAYCRSRYALFSLRAYPGPRAQTGWLTSNVAFDDLVRQFSDGVGTEHEPLEGSVAHARKVVDGWFDTDKLKRELQVHPIALDAPCLEKG